MVLKITPPNATQVLSHIKNYQALILAHPLYISHPNLFDPILHQIVRCISVSTSDIALSLSISVATRPFLKDGNTMMEQLNARLKEVSFPSPMRTSMVQEHFCSSNALASLHSFQIYRERVIIIRDLALLSEDVILASIITHIDRACLADPNCATLRVKWSMPGFRPLSVHDAFAQIFQFMQQYPPLPQAFSAAVVRYVSPRPAKPPISGDKEAPDQCVSPEVSSETSAVLECAVCGRCGHSACKCFKVVKCTLCGMLPGHMKYLCPKAV